ncbi:MAG: rhomboid family intramembrane serine protease [Bacteroidota bacterium]
MAWGISPRKTVLIYLGDYSTDHYLTLLYHAFNNLGWRISYFDRDGIIGYTPISWASYAEEVSVRIINNQAIVKSECVGYQFLFNDYGKNSKNLELLLNGEIEYVEYHLKDTLQQTTQQLIDSIPDNQFVSLADPPMGYKEKLRGFLSAFTPKPGYFITPILVLSNIIIFIFTIVFFIAMMLVYAIKAQAHHGTEHVYEHLEDIYLSLGFSNRRQVLNGQVWRLISNTFLHFSFTHLAGNMVVLIYIGSLLEGKLGRWTYLFLYLLTGICASITSVVWRDQGVAAGASGAIFGLFGILLALLSTKFYELSARRALLISTAIFVGYIILPKGNNQVDHAAHFGGLISGYIFGQIAYLGLTHNKQKLTAIYAAAITIIYTTLCIWLAPVYQFTELKALSDKTKKLSDELKNDFYGNYNTQRDTMMKLFVYKALPRIDTLNKVGKQIQQLTLPKKQKQIADVKAKIIFEECKLYKLLYKEYRDRDQKKYRQEINNSTQIINDLRIKWGEIDNRE